MLLLGVADAQWLNYPDPQTPRTADRKPDLKAPTPKTADGHPDLSGVWHAEIGCISEGSDDDGGGPLTVRSISRGRSLHMVDPTTGEATSIAYWSVSAARFS